MSHRIAKGPRRARRRAWGHRLPLASALLLLTLLPAGCGGSGSTSTTTSVHVSSTALGAVGTTVPATGSASASGATATTGTSAAGSSTGAATAPSTGTTPGRSSTGATGAAASSRASTILKNSRFQKALSRFAACLRQNGVAIGEPNTSGKGPLFDTKGISTSSPQFKAASAKCRATLFKALQTKPAANAKG